MPSAVEVRKLYVDQGMSFTEIADRFGVRKNSVLLKLQRHARKNGLEWPIPGRADRRGAKHSEARWSAVKTALLVAEVKEAVERFQCAEAQLCEFAGVTPSVLSAMMTGKKLRVSLATARKLMAAIEALEDGRLVADAHRYRMRRRQRKMGEAA